MSEVGDHTLVVEGVGANDEVVAVSVGFTVLERTDNTWAAVLAIVAAMLLALLGGRPVWRRRKARTTTA
jgi:membrane protein DedA with SNARE-associated domain